LALTPALVRAGLAREVIRTIQEQRKSSGFEISYRFHVLWNGGTDLEAAINEFAVQISEEVLALSIAKDAKLSIDENEIGLGLTLTKA
jgi:isoleucyl-tRNA synthetase